MAMPPPKPSTKLRDRVVAHEVGPIVRALRAEGHSRWMTWLNSSEDATGTPAASSEPYGPQSPADARCSRAAVATAPCDPDRLAPSASGYLR